MFKLRKYQEDAVKFCTKKLANDKNSLLVAATGAGKTIMLSAVARWIANNSKGKIYVIVGRDKINQQNIDKFRQVVPEYAASEYSGRMKSMHGRVVFMTVQTAINHFEKLPKPVAIIYDEVQHSRAKSYEELTAYWNPEFLFGATATPIRGDKKTLGTLFDNFYQISARELIAMNYLSKPEFHNFNSLWDIPDGLFGDLLLKYIENLKKDLKKSFEELERLPGKSIIFCRNHSVAIHVKETLQEMGESVSYIKSGGYDNDEEMDRFIKGKTQWLVNVDIATEGFDDPYIMNVFNLCIDGSRSRWVQKVGRGLRPHQNKTVCRIFDCGGNIENYGDLDFTEVLPKAAETRNGKFIILDDPFADESEKKDDNEEQKPELQDIPESCFKYGQEISPYAAPDGWFSFYDLEYGVVYIRNDGKLARYNGVEIKIYEESDIEIDNIDFGIKPESDDINNWQLRKITDIPSFGMTKNQADAVLSWKLWKKKTTRQ